MRKEFSKFQQKGKPQGGKEEEMLSAFAKKYEGKSEGELIREIMAVAKENRKNGTLSDEEIDRYVSLLAPMLGEDKRKKLYAVSEKIKSEK
ncbi:MAG: hypothetical protein IKC56_03940 [Clostridia bacterium]|nr:hypothetical protein [Clostridia bacterium]